MASSMRAVRAAASSSALLASGRYSRRFSATVQAKSTGSCGSTTTLRALTGAVKSRWSVPPMRMVPASGSIYRSSSRARVLFPEPDGPIIARVWPGATWKVQPARPVEAPGYR